MSNRDSIQVRTEAFVMKALTESTGTRPDEEIVAKTAERIIAALPPVAETKP